MASGSISVTDIIKPEESKSTRSNALDMQLWHSAWEEAYLAMQTESEVRGEVAGQNVQTSNTTEHPEPVSPAQQKRGAVPVQPAMVDNLVSAPVTSDKSMAQTLLSPKSVVMNASSPASLNGVSQVNSLNNNNLTARSITQSASSPPSFSAMSNASLAKNGFHVFVADNGDVKVWLRNQELQEKTGLALLTKLRDTFSQLGYSLSSFALNGKVLFEDNGAQQTVQASEDEPLIINKSY